MNDDRAYLSNTSGTDLPAYPSSATVWGTAIATQFAGKSPWEIFGLLYGNSDELVYALRTIVA